MLNRTLNGVKYDIFCMKEPDYTMEIMSTYGGLTVKEGQCDSKRVYTKDREQASTNFKYTETIANHFDYRHIVDNHNNLRNQITSIKEKRRTHRWENSVFNFFI